MASAVAPAYMGEADEQWGGDDFPLPPANRALAVIPLNVALSSDTCDNFIFSTLRLKQVMCRCQLINR
jgi:hypothetical protein